MTIAAGFRSIFIAAFLPVAAMQAFAYDGSPAILFGLPSMTPLRAVEVDFAHRFNGDVREEPWSNFFGLRQGANVELSTRAGLLEGLEVTGSGVLKNKEYDVGAGYGARFGTIPLGLHLRVHYNTYDRAPFGPTPQRVHQALAMAGFEVLDLCDYLSLLANVGFASYDSRLGLGLGVLVTPWEFLGAFAEVSPPLGDEKHALWHAGIKSSTYGHQFLLFIGNGTSISLRPFLFHTKEEVYPLTLGFAIRRLFQW